MLVACQETPALYPATAPPEIRQACELTEQRCTTCHERDRIVYARMNTEDWRETIDRMRRMPGSTIKPGETDTILYCLLNRGN